MQPEDAWLDLSAVSGLARLQETVRRSLAAIDRVHRFPPVAQPISVVPAVELQAAGRYIAEPGNERILIRPGITRLSVVLLHELGHVFDHYAAGGHGRLLTDELALTLETWWQATQASDVYDHLRRTLRTYPQVEPRLVAARLLRPNELFARCYAQYVISKSADQGLVDELRAVQGLDSGAAILPLRWTDADFDGIRNALDEFMEARGWLRHSE